jgi:hypothetical protein
VKPTEIHALETLDELLAKPGVATVYNEIMNSKQECMAPVFTAEQSNEAKANFGLMPNGLVVYEEGSTIFDFSEMLHNPGPTRQHDRVLGPFPKLQYVCRPISRPLEPQGAPVSTK